MMSKLKEKLFVKLIKYKTKIFNGSLLFLALSLVLFIGPTMILLTAKEAALESLQHFTLGYVLFRLIVIIIPIIGGKYVDRLLIFAVNELFSEVTGTQNLSSQIILDDKINQKRGVLKYHADCLTLYNVEIKVKQTRDNSVAVIPVLEIKFVRSGMFRAWANIARNKLDRWVREHILGNRLAVFDYVENASKDDLWMKYVREIELKHPLFKFYVTDENKYSYDLRVLKHHCLNLKIDAGTLELWDADNVAEKLLRSYKHINATVGGPRYIGIDEAENNRLDVYITCQKDHEFITIENEPQLNDRQNLSKYRFAISSCSLGDLLKRLFKDGTTKTSSELLDALTTYSNARLLDVTGKVKIDINTTEATVAEFIAERIVLEEISAFVVTEDCELLNLRIYKSGDKFAYKLEKRL